MCGVQGMDGSSMLEEVFLNPLLKIRAKSCDKLAYLLFYRVSDWKEQHNFLERLRNQARKFGRWSGLMIPLSFSYLAFL